MFARLSITKRESNYQSGEILFDEKSTQNSSPNLPNRILGGPEDLSGEMGDKGP